MTKILVLYYSMYGHIETMAKSVAVGVNAVDGVECVIKRVPEIMSQEALERAGAKIDQDAPIAEPAELENYDGIIFGTPTRFGNMAAQMRNFMDQTGSLWMSNALVGKVGSVFTSTGTGGGNETTLQSFHTTLFHLGFVVVGLPYTCTLLVDISQAKGGSPLGAGTLAASDGSRVPSEIELSMASFQGGHVAQITRKLFR